MFHLAALRLCDSLRCGAYGTFCYDIIGIVIIKGLRSWFQWSSYGARRPSMRSTNIRSDMGGQGPFAKKTRHFTYVGSDKAQYEQYR